MLEDLQRYPLRIAAAAPLAGPALEIATDLGRSFYDCLYLALAQREDSALVTADRRFYDAVRGSTLTSRIRWVEG